MKSAFLAIALAIDLFVASSAHSAGPPPPVYKEHLKQKLVCNSGGCNEPVSGSYSAKYEAGPFNAGTFDSLDANTVFHFVFGHLDFAAPLGSDPNYSAGDTQATFHVVINIAGGKTKGVITLKLSWKDNLLKLNVKGTTPGSTSPVASDRIGGSQNITEWPVNSQVRLENSGVDVINFSYSLVPYASDIKRKTKTVNSTEYTVDNIKISGPIP